MDKNTTVGNDKIRSLFDAGTFVELGAFVRSSASAEVYDGVICGYGSMGGKLVFAFAQDMDRMKGAMDAAGAKKLRTLYDMALKNGAPIVGLFDSAGAAVYEGSAVLGAYGEWLACISSASGIVPQIAVIEGVCAGVAAVAASMFDIVLTVKDKTQMYVTSPFILGENTATAEAAAKSGLAAAVCGCEKCAAAKVRELIELLPQNNCDRACAGAEDPNRAIAPDAQLPGALLDGGVMSELYADFAPEMTVALGRMGGETVGVVYAHGALTVDAARKATKFISFCDCFGITLVTLVDSEGVSVDEAAQSAPAAAVFGKLASAYANASCAKITVTVGKAYGSAYTLLGSKALGADVAFALPNAVISTMAPDKAVAFVWNDKVTNETSREDVEKEWIETYATPEKAAANGDIDDVIAPEELRARLCSAIYMLAAKTNGALTRKHVALPL